MRAGRAAELVQYNGGGHGHVETVQGRVGGEGGRYVDPVGGGGQQRAGDAGTLATHHQQGGGGSRHQLGRCYALPTNILLFVILLLFTHLIIIVIIFVLGRLELAREVGC